MGREGMGGSGGEGGTAQNPSKTEAERGAEAVHFGSKTGSGNETRFGRGSCRPGGPSGAALGDHLEPLPGLFFEAETFRLGTWARLGGQKVVFKPRGAYFPLAHLLDAATSGNSWQGRFALVANRGKLAWHQW